MSQNRLHLQMVMEKRKEISLDMTKMDIILVMAEGNPGAIGTLADLMGQPGGLMEILALDDMNIRGTQVWIAYNDHCKKNMGFFRECIIHRNQGMIDVVNNEGQLGNHSWKAVQYGASMGNRQTLTEKVSA